MLSAQSFFDLPSWEHPGLMRSGDQAWIGLKNLQPYLDEQGYPELTPALIQDGEPLKRTLVYYNGTLLGRKSMVIPNTTVPSGYHPDSSLIR